MSRTGSKGSASTMVALTAGGAVFVLVSAAFGQGVQGPNTFQGGTGGPNVNPAGTPIYMNKGGTNPAGAVDAFNKAGTNPAGAVDAFHKGDPRFGTTAPGGAGLLTGPKSLQAAPPASPTKAAGAEPPPSPSKGVGATNPGAAASPRDAASTPAGPRAAGYLKSPTKGDPKDKIGDIKGVGSCATGKVC
jgi:hypothetical protein